MIRPRFLVLLAALAASACHDHASKMPAAQEIPPNAVAEFCGMSLREHSGPKAELFVKGRAAPYWFASVHDMFAFTLLPEEPRAIVAIYVSDMGRAHDWDHPEPGTWIDAHKAVFVIGSDRSGGMEEAEAVPFGTDAAARAFIARSGGRMVRFAAMPEDYILPGASPDPGANREKH
jgi:copper chaperone NosL